MDITCVSDLHGAFPNLDGGDLLIVAGDLTGNDTETQYLKFFEWLTFQSYRKIVFIAGNHDNYLESYKPTYANNIEYLCDSGIEFEGLKIWGSPWTKYFVGMNTDCMAFTLDSEEELSHKFCLIPTDTDILITHSPVLGVLDKIKRPRIGENVHQGSESLMMPLLHSNCRLHVCGHIHESYGIFKNNLNGITHVNASYVNERYKPVNKPIRVIL